MRHRLFSKKVFAPVIAGVLVLGGSAAYLFPRLKVIVPLRLKYSRNASPRMYLVPQQRKVAEPADANRGFVYASGLLRFAVPLKAVRVFDSEYARAFVFENGKSVIVSGQKEGDGVLSALLGDDPQQAEAMRQFWGPENLQSEYAAIRFCLNATPDAGGIFGNGEELRRLPSKLLLKAVYSPLGDVIYQYETERFRGFQFGSPRNSRTVFIYLFDTFDRLYRMRLSAINQDEIDLLLASIEFAPKI